VQHIRATSSVLLASLQEAVTNAGADLAAEVERLRTLLERQPSCLMRVGLDGTMLAVSDAAVSLLGASGLAEVLDASLIGRLHGDGAQLWSDFVARVLYAGSASAECEMNDLTGVRRAVILQGVLLPGHPDGSDSLLLVFRDVSTARRLEASLQEQEDLRRSAQHDLQQAKEHIEGLQTRLDEVTADRQQLRATLDVVVAERQELASALKQLKSALGTAIDSTLLAQQVVDKGRRQ
jgi:PAS domain-containing protein